MVVAAVAVGTDREMRKTSIEIAMPIIRPIVSKSHIKKASIEIL